MILDITFSESQQSFNPQFGEVHNVSDGGYEKGYNSGYAEGIQKGYSEGLAARTYETWTIALVDGTIVEKEVSLL